MGVLQFSCSKEDNIIELPQLPEKNNIKISKLDFDEIKQTRLKSSVSKTLTHDKENKDFFFLNSGLKVSLKDVIHIQNINNESFTFSIVPDSLNSTVKNLLVS